MQASREFGRAHTFIQRGEEAVESAGHGRTAQAGIARQAKLRFQPAGAVEVRPARRGCVGLGQAPDEVVVIEAEARRPCGVGLPDRGLAFRRNRVVAAPPARV